MRWNGASEERNRPRTDRTRQELSRARDETEPNRNLSNWVRHHDRYGPAAMVAPTGRWVPAAAEACCESQA